MTDLVWVPLTNHHWQTLIEGRVVRIEDIKDSEVFVEGGPSVPLTVMIRPPRMLVSLPVDLMQISELIMFPEREGFTALTRARLHAVVSYVWAMATPAPRPLPEEIEKGDDHWYIMHSHHPDGSAMHSHSTVQTHTGDVTNRLANDHTGVATTCCMNAVEGKDHNSYCLRVDQ